MRVQVGEAAPPFTLPDQNGNPWALADHRGRPVVLYFFPRADTPGCSNQACDVRDHWADFAATHAEVVGISPDDVGTQAAFADKYDLPHRLLADTDRNVIRAYGAWGEKTIYGRTVEGVLRSSVVVAPDGTVAAVFDRIKPGEQSALSLAAIRSFAES